MSDSIALIVVNSSIPYNGPSTLHDCVQKLLFVSDGSRHWGMRDVMETDNLHGVTCLAKQMIRQVKQTGTLNNRQVNLIYSQSLQHIICCFLQAIVVL